MAAAPVRRGRARRSYQPMSEINVTPFVDVMLVLLVIFMVTAPLLTVAVPVDLPKARAAAIGQPDKPLIVSVRADGTVFLQETQMDTATLIARLKAIARDRSLSIEDRFQATLQLGAMPRNGAATRLRNRCEVSGRPRGFYRKFKLSRIALRELGSAGQVPGLVKSSW